MTAGHASTQVRPDREMPPQLADAYAVAVREAAATAPRLTQEQAQALRHLLDGRARAS